MSASTCPTMTRASACAQRIQPNGDGGGQNAEGDEESGRWREEHRPLDAIVWIDADALVLVPSLSFLDLPTALSSPFHRPFLASHRPFLTFHRPFLDLPTALVLALRWSSRRSAASRTSSPRTRAPISSLVTTFLKLVSATSFCHLFLPLACLGGGLCAQLCAQG